MLSLEGDRQNQAIVTCHFLDQTWVGLIMDYSPPFAQCGDTSLQVTFKARKATLALPPRARLNLYGDCFSSDLDNEQDNYEDRWLKYRESELRRSRMILNEQLLLGGS